MVPEGRVARHLSADVIEPDIADAEPIESPGPSTPALLPPSSSSPARARSHQRAASQQKACIAAAMGVSSPPPAASGVMLRGPRLAGTATAEDLASPRKKSPASSPGVQQAGSVGAAAAETSPLRAQSWAEPGAAQLWSSDLMAELHGTMSRLRVADPSGAAGPANGGEAGAAKVPTHRKTRSVL